MSEPRDAELIRRMTALLVSRMTKVGHLAAVVVQEHRGNCSPRACTPACEEAGALIVEADHWLTEYEQAVAVERPTQGRLLEVVG